MVSAISSVGVINQNAQMLLVIRLENPEIWLVLELRLRMMPSGRVGRAAQRSIGAPSAHQ